MISTNEITLREEWMICLLQEFEVPNESSNVKHFNKTLVRGSNQFEKNE